MKIKDKFRCGRVNTIKFEPVHLKPEFLFYQKVHGKSTFSNIIYPEHKFLIEEKKTLNAVYLYICEWMLLKNGLMI